MNVKDHSLFAYHITLQEQYRNAVVLLIIDVCTEEPLLGLLTQTNLISSDRICIGGADIQPIRKERTPGTYTVEGLKRKRLEYQSSAEVSQTTKSLQFMKGATPAQPARMSSAASHGL